MRNELHHIEQIEKYLMGTFSSEEKMQFENALKTSPALQHDVDLQQQLMKRIMTNAFITDVKNFHNGFTGNKRGGLTGGIILNSLLALAVLSISLIGFNYFSKEDNHPSGNGSATTSVTPYSQDGGDVIRTSNPTVTDSTALKEETSCEKDSTRRSLNPMNDAAAKYIPGYLQVPYTVKEVDASQSCHIKMTSRGSIIHIPPHVLVHKNGDPVVGKFQVKYREFRDAGDMVFSDIPMTYAGDGSEMHMNSVGMFEIRAFRNGEELKIAEGRSIAVDYAVTQQLDSVYFFSLNDETKKWKKRFRILPFMFKDKIRWGHGNPDYRNFDERADSMRRARRDTVTSINADKNQSDVVRNLRLSYFGIYNCDQINKQMNVVNITASYLNTEGDKIDNMNMLAVIDRNFNNVMLYHPEKFKCDWKGKNILVLVATDGHVYSVDEKNFKNMQIVKSGNYEFTVADITDKVKNLDEFKKQLGL